MTTSDISLDDVARAAGVSPATASRALNGKAGVRDDLRHRVKAVATGLGYRPNRAAKNLAGGRTSVIGLVMGTKPLVEDIYATALVQAVANAANAADEGLMLVLDSTNPTQAVRELISDGLVEGIIISAVAIGERWVEELLDAQMPTVLVGSHPRRNDVPVVDVDQRAAAATLVGHLLDSGCRQVATITGRPSRVDTERRLDGYHHAHHERGLSANPDLVFDGDFSYESGLRAAKDICDQVETSTIDGVFAGNDLMAYAVLAEAQERGIDVPRQLSIAGFDGIAPLPTLDTKLATAKQPFAELANAAVLALTTLIDGQDVPQEQLIKAPIVLGDTVLGEGQKKDGG